MDAFTILYEDAYLLAVNKPAGIAVEGEVDALEEQVKVWLQQHTKYPDKIFVQSAHRIDKPVSGVVVLAKKRDALKRMMQLFRDKQVTKKYIAVVEGQPANTTGTLEHYLIKNNALQKAVVGNPANGSLAILKYKVLHPINEWSVLDVEPITGRYHQIRAQLAAVGCPIVGDVKYGAKTKAETNAIALHAAVTEFVHPVTNQPMRLSAPLPTTGIWANISEIRIEKI